MNKMHEPHNVRGLEPGFLSSFPYLSQVKKSRYEQSINDAIINKDDVPVRQATMKGPLR